MINNPLAEGAKELLERQDTVQSTNPQELILDDSNEVSFPGFPYTFEALGEKILVSIDVFKSGYECKVCNGMKRIKYQCSCIVGGRPGYKFSSDELDSIKEALGVDVAEARKEIPCPECAGMPDSVERDEICTACKGIGATIVIPKSGENLPTTGVVVSMGAEAKEKAAFKIGDRILFSTYSGSMIPTKAGLMFKYMEWYQAVVKIKGADNLGAFDFIVKEDE